jgi:hypothetical protein
MICAREQYAIVPPSHSWHSSLRLRVVELVPIGRHAWLVARV